MARKEAYKIYGEREETPEHRKWWMQKLEKKID